MTRKVWIDFGDVNWLDYGGRWIKKIDDTRFHVIELINWEEAVGEREAAEIGARYNVSLSEVDLANADLDSATDSWGMEEGYWESIDPGMLGYVLADCVDGYGQKAPISNDNGNNAHKLIREAKAESRRLVADPDFYDSMMERPVNRLGSTAREYQRGDLDSGLIRGLFAGDRNCQIMAKICGLTEEEINAFTE